MGLRVTFKEWVILVILASIFIALTSILISLYFDVAGSIIITIALVIIFVIFKLYQYLKKKDEEKDEKEA